MAIFEQLNGIAISKQEWIRRKKHIRTITIHYPKYEEMLNLLEEMLDMFEIPDQLFIYGPTGVGKSTVTKEFLKRYPVVEVVTSDRKYKRITVLRVEVPPKATPKSLAAAILESIGDPTFNKGTEQELTSRILYYIRSLEIKIIIIDEFQHLIDADTDHVLVTAANWLKSFTDKCAIPVVLCGMPSSVNIFVKEEQLDRRYFNMQAMEAFQYSEPEEVLNFRAFLHKIEGELPFYSRPHFSDRKMADKLFYISLGIPFYIMKLLEIASELALKNGEDQITESHLQQALTKIKIVSRPFRINPFNMHGFDLSEEFVKEKAAEDRFKAELLGQKPNKRRKKTVI